MANWLIVALAIYFSGMPRLKRLPPKRSAHHTQRHHTPQQADRPEVPAEYQGNKCCRIASAIARLDGSEHDIAEALGVGTSTLQLWQNTHADFALALRPAVDVTDGSVVRAMIEHALGSEYRTDTILGTRQGQVVRSETVHLSPNVEVLHFLLKGRMPGFMAPLSIQPSPD